MTSAHEFTPDILYQDEHLVIVNKPSGLMVHRGPAPDTVVAMTLVRDAIGAYVYPVHRLDRGTSGALVFALSSASARAIQESFAARQVEKWYIALVRGIAPASGVIDHAIQKREGGPRVDAVSEFRRVFETDNPGHYSVVQVMPRSGRRHQVRRHLKHISHPIIGDVRYGKGPHNRLFRTRFNLHRLALHAQAIRFPHPVTDASVSVSAPLPDDLAMPLNALGASTQFEWST